MSLPLAALTAIPYTCQNNPWTYAAACKLGLDGVFSKFPDIAANVRDQVFGTGTPVPEPHSLAPIGLGLAGLGAFRKRRPA